MAKVARSARSATYEDIVGLPEGVVGEIIDGELWTQPRPAPRHAQSNSHLGVLIGGPFGLGINGPGGWVLLDEPEIQFASHTLVPDMAGWKVERLPDLPERGPLLIAPDWICEVLSPSTESKDRRRKLPIYAAHGVQHAWLVDPVLRTLEVLRLQNGSWLLLGTFGDDDLVRAEPFDAVEIPLRLLWGTTLAAAVR